VIAELFPAAYDIGGRKVFRPDLRRHSKFRPTFPIGRFLSQPLKTRCSDFEELRWFLGSCKYVSDERQFGKRDYWQPPEQFEESKRGDCDDFALWAWRQTMEMGYPARLVTGTAGRYGEGHAWVTFEKEGKTFLLEPLARHLGLVLPRLSTLRYRPEFSVAWDGATISYYVHEKRNYEPSLWGIPPLVWEWIAVWIPFWIKASPKLLGRLLLLPWNWIKSIR